MKEKTNSYFVKAIIILSSLKKKKKLIQCLSKSFLCLGVISSFLYPSHFISFGKTQFWCHCRQDEQPLCPLVAEKDSLSLAKHLSQDAQWV